MLCSLAFRLVFKLPSLAFFVIYFLFNDRLVFDIAVISPILLFRKRCKKSVDSEWRSKLFTIHEDISFFFIEVYNFHP